MLSFTLNSIQNSLFPKILDDNCKIGPAFALIIAEIFIILYNYR